MARTKLDTLKPLMCEEAILSFPPHHRSHLKSKTFQTLVRILSLCVDESQSSNELRTVSENPKLGTHGVELRQTTQEERHSVNLSVENDNRTDKSAEVIGLQNKTFSPSKIVTDELVCIEENKELACLDHFDSSVFLVEKDSNVDHVAASINNHYDNFCLDQSILGESERGVQETMDNESVNFDISEAIKPVDDTRSTSCLEMNIVEELEPERQHKDDAIMDSFAGLIEDREIEEGEIPGDLGVCNQSNDSFLEQSVLHETRKVEEGQIPGDLIKKGKCASTSREQKGTEEEEGEFTSHLVATESTDGCVQKELVEKKRKGKEDKPNTLDRGKTWKVEHAFGGDCILEAGIDKNEVYVAKVDTNCPVDYPDGLGHPREISHKVVSENQRNTSREKDVKVGDKRKRVLTKERKAKKKLKKCKKRAEKNKQLGVKRLKLQIITKPKTVKYCNHYLHGRCQQGDSCKFSHDTTPLTKSQPCRFFALHSCLKGDDCPFDHQLSKYPCNNYKSKGFCSRGDSCLFSHKLLPMESSSPASDVSPAELKSPSMPGGTNSGRQNNKSASHQSPNTSKETTPVIPSSLDTFIQRYVGLNSAEMRLKPPRQVPKGISFLSFGKTPCDDSSKQHESDLPSERDNGSQVCNLKNQSASEKFQNSNEMLASQLPLSQPPNTLVGWQNKSTPNSAQKALLSTLAFGSKYESGKIMGQSIRSSAPNAEIDKGSKSGGSSSSGNGSMSASKILQEFLFGGEGNSL